MNSNQILAEGWRLTTAILALKGLRIPSTIHFQIDGIVHIRATRIATLEDLAKAVAALDDAIEGRWAVGIPSYLRDYDDGLNATKNALMELQKRASWEGKPASTTTVIEALSPTYPSRGGPPTKRPRLSAGWRSGRKRRSRSTPRLLRSTGHTNKPWTRMA
jgi:hypothetical protein